MKPRADINTWYKLLSVQSGKDFTQTPSSERNFITADVHLLLISLADGGSLIIDGLYHSIRSGSVFVCAPGQLLEVSLPENSADTCLLLRFTIMEWTAEEDDQEKLALITRFPVNGEVMITPASVVLQLCNSVYQGWNSGLPSDRLHSEAVLLELLAVILRNHEQKASLALEDARRELERYSHEELTVDDLANTAGLSRFHFMRLFKEKYGMGVTDFRAAVRLQKAKLLMEAEASLSIGDIAYKVGYHNESYFNRIFKRQTGMTPAIYMRRRSFRVAAYSWVNFGQLLPLQVIPYAAPVDHYWTDHYRTRFKDEVKVPLSHHYDYNREALQKANPDYIIGMHSLVPEGEQEKLRKIAPALFLASEENWRTQLLLTGEFLKLEGESDRWLKSYERKRTGIREQLRQVLDDEILLILLISQGQIFIAGRRAGTVLYDDLLFAYPSFPEEVDWMTKASVQQLSAYRAGRILLNIGMDDASQMAWLDLSRTDEWKELKAVKEGRLHLTSAQFWLECPWNEYSAYHFGQFIMEVPRLLGVKK